MRMLRWMGTLAGLLAMGLARDARAQYSYVPSPPPCVAPAPVRPKAAPRAADMPTLGVLALHLQRATADERFLADAFPDALTRRLSGLSRLWLFTPYAVRRLPPNSTPNAVRVARELGTRFLLTGILDTDRGAPSVEVVLYDTLATEPAWRQRFRMEAGLLAKAESTAVMEIATRLLPNLTPAERAMLTRRETKSVVAFERFLRGEDAARERGSGYATRAAAFFGEAVAADSLFGVAHTARALALLAMLEEGAREAMAKPDSVARLALHHAELATAVDNKSARAWSARGAALAFDKAHWKEARDAAAYAASLDKRDPEVAWQRGRVLLRIGQRREAEESFRAALVQSPAFAPALGDLGDLMLNDRSLDAACGWFNAAIAADPYRPIPYALRAIARRGDADVRLGWSDAEIAGRLGARSYGEAASALVDIRGNDSTRARTRALKLFRELDRRTRLGVTDARLAALALVALGDNMRAVSLLERAYPRDGALRVVLADPGFAPLHSDERFRRIVAELSAPPPAPRASGKRGTS